MKKHTTFKIGGNADCFVKVKDIETLQKLIEYTNKNEIPFFIIGNGSNLLVKDNGIRGVVAKLDFKKCEIENLGDSSYINVSADIPGSMLARKVAKLGLTGMEFLGGIPCTIGGAVRMNAGAYKQEIKDVLVSVKYLDSNGNIVEKDAEDLGLAYRTSKFASNNDIVLEAKFKLTQDTEENVNNKMNEMLTSRKEKQPIEYPSAGSTFKRKGDIITAKLIDECGLKGYTIGGASVSIKHAGFIINKNNATAKDVLKLIDIIKEKVYARFNVKIELEIIIIGE